jgi:sugar/nucleoside kinase (ribokinase family)
MAILCVGQLVADVVLRPVGKLPYPGRTEPVEELDLLSGGCAANTAAVLADQRRAGVDVGAVKREAAWPTSVAIVLVDPAGQRSFYYRAGGCEKLANHHLADEALRAARIVHVGGAMKMLNLDLAELMAKAKAFGCITSLDTDWDIYGNWMRKLEGALPRLDYLITNEEEAAQLAGKEDPGESARALLGAGPRAVTVKRGERGAVLATRDGLAEFPAYRVDVRDTTCAGDAFAAGFLLGVSQGDPLEEAVRLGNAAGALCTTRISHRGITSLEAVRSLIEEQKT